MLRMVVAIVSLFICAAYTSADPGVPDRDEIEAKMAEMEEYSAKNDFSSWASFFADDATFMNSALPEPVVGKDAIIELAGTWTPAEIVIEWRIIEGARVVFAWRERRQLSDGKMTGWYRGFSTFVFNANAEVQSYEGMFNLLAIKAAMTGPE